MPFTMATGVGTMCWLRPLLCELFDNQTSFLHRILSVEPLGDCPTSVLNLSELQQIGQGSGHGRRPVGLGRERASHPEPYQSGSVGELIEGHRHHQLRDAGSQRLRNGADTAV